MNSELNRRTFLKWVGAGTGAGLLPACTDAPVQKLYAYLEPPAGVTPGQARWLASVCRDCPAGCGLHVKTREGRPIKLEGNPTSPINQGALCLRGQSALQDLYDPDCLTQPQVGQPGQTRSVPPTQALRFFAEKWRAASAEGSVALLSGGQTGTGALFFQQLAEQWDARWLAYETVQFAALQAASSHLFGLREVPRFDLAETDFVLSLGADLSESWMSPVEHARQLARPRSALGEQRAPLVCVSPRRDLTAAAADAWISVRPGSLGWVALGLARAVIDHKAAAGNASPAWAKILDPYHLPKMAGRAGCAVKQLEALASRLVQARRPVALPPAETQLGKDGVFEQAAVLLLDLALGAIDQSVLYGEQNPYNLLAPAQQLQDLWQQARAGKLSALILVDSNPIYQWPDKKEVQEALAQIPLVVQLTRRLNESSPWAQVILPTCHFLQSWGDAQPRADWIALQQPVYPLRGQQAAAEDWLIQMSTAMGKPTAWRNFRQCLAQHWTGLQQQLEPEADATRFFRSALSQGGRALPPPEAWDEITKNVWGPQEVATRKRRQTPLTAADLPRRKVVDSSGEDSSLPGSPWLLTYASGRLYDGRSANRSWIQETPDALTQVVWDTPLELSVGLAKRLGVTDGDQVRVGGAGGIQKLSVRLIPGARDDLVALPLGGGQWTGRVAAGRGSHALALLKAETMSESGSLAFLQTRVSIRKLHSGQLLTVEGNPRTHDRPILSADKTQKPAGGTQAKQVDPHPPGSFNEPHHFPEHMWGMTVDLDLCNGCSACVVACQAENNIATVGPEQITQGREMHWIRIERYWDQADDRPLFLPVMCQHCENAPCETVCPVFASYHTRDGLNAQVYNRCIGTRYCSNNCPYKVRRFNWFDYSWPPPLDQQLNPDVSVRSVGVMEKCTFCIQRIRERTNMARAEGRALAPDEILPACVQTCPTGALRFGDRKQADSRVSQLAKDPRAYRLLDTQLNTQPAVTYLSRKRTEI